MKSREKNGALVIRKKIVYNILYILMVDILLKEYLVEWRKNDEIQPWFVSLLPVELNIMISHDPTKLTKKPEAVGAANILENLSKGLLAPTDVNPTPEAPKIIHSRSTFR